MANLPANYDEQVYAALLGKVIGVQYGGPIEGWTDDRIWQTYGELTRYVQHYHYFRPDDDLSGPLVFIRALEDFTPTEDLTPQDIGNTWLNYLGDGHCTLWWGGYGVSTEHTAYLNLANGIPAPRSGSIEQNGRVAFEKNWMGYQEVASAPFAWELGQEYTLAVRAVGRRMEGFVDGQRLLEWTDAETPWESGCIGLGLKNGRTMFLSVVLRPAP